MLFFHLCHSLCVQEIVISGMRDYHIDMSNDKVLEIFCLFPDTSIVIHNSEGWSAYVVYNDGIFGNMTNSESPNLIDFASKTGRVIVHFFSKYESHFHFSSIIYSQFIDSNGCVGQRIVSIGGYHKMTIAGLLSGYYDTKNESFDLFMDMCIWFASPITLSHSIEYNIYEGSDFLRLYHPSELINISSSLSMTGHGSNNLDQSQSIMVRFSNVRSSKSFYIRIESIPNDSIYLENIQSATITYSYNTSLSIKGSYDSSLVSILDINIDRMGDYYVNLSGFQIFRIHCNVATTSIAILNKKGWVAYIVYNSVFLGLTNDHIHDNPVFDFGSNTGYITMFKTTKDSDDLYFSSIIYSRFNSVSCEQKIVSFGGYHQYMIAEKLDLFYSVSNTTMENNQKICYWIVSPVKLYHNLNYKMHNSYDFLYFYHNEANLTSSLNYISKYSSDVLAETILITKGSSLFYWKTDASVLLGRFSVVSEPYLMNSNISQISDSTHKYSLSSQIIINYFDSNPNTIYTINTLTDFVISTTNLKFVFIKIPFSQTSIIIHEATGWMAEAFSYGTPVMNKFCPSRNPQILDFGQYTGFICIQVINVPNNQLHISGIVYSKANGANQCNGTRYVSIGSYHQFTVASSGSYYDSRNATVSNGNCIWFASHRGLISETVYSLYYSSYYYKRYSYLSLFTSTEFNSTASEIVESLRYYSSGSGSFSSLNSILLYPGFYNAESWQYIQTKSRPSDTFGEEITNISGSGIFSYYSSSQFKVYSSVCPPTPIITPAPSVVPSPQVTQYPSNNPTPQVTPNLTPTLQVTPNQTPTPQATSTPYETPNRSNDPTPQVTPNPSDNPTPQETPNRSNDPTPQVTPNPSDNPTPQETPNRSNDPTPQVTPNPSDNPTPQETPNRSNDLTPQVTPNPSDNPTPQETPNRSNDPTPQVTPNPSDNPTPQETPNRSNDLTPQVTPNPSDYPTPQETPNRSNNPTPQVTPNRSNDLTPQVTPNPSDNPTPQETPNRSNNPTPQETPNDGLSTLGTFIAIMSSISALTFILILVMFFLVASKITSSSSSSQAPKQSFQTNNVNSIPSNGNIYTYQNQHTVNRENSFI